MLTAKTNLRNRPYFYLTAVLALAWVHAQAAAHQPTAWKSGDAFRRRLEGKIEIIEWSANPLRSGLENLSRAQQIAVFLDRHIDPGKEITLTLRNVPVDEVFKRLAGRIQAGVCCISSVLYIGPMSLTEKLATVAAVRRDETDKLPPAIRGRLTKADAWHWDELSAPRDLLSQLEERYEVQILNPEVVAHDLWPAGDFPPLEFADRLTLILAGFGLTFEYVPPGNVVRLVPLPENASVQRTYSPRGDVVSAVRQLTGNFPGAQIARRGDRIVVNGSWEDHESIQRLMRGEQAIRRTSTPAEIRYSVKIQNQPVGQVIRVLADKLMLELTIDPGADPSLLKLISFQVKEVPQDELLKAALVPAGLTFKLDGRELKIRQASPP